MRGSGAPAYQANTWASGQFAVGNSHVRGAGFVPTRHDTNRLFGVIQGVQYVQMALARNAKDQVDPMALQLVDDDATTSTIFGHCCADSKSIILCYAALPTPLRLVTSCMRPFSVPNEAR
jgi:hypothetical protein